MNHYIVTATNVRCAIYVDADLWGYERDDVGDLFIAETPGKAKSAALKAFRANGIRVEYADLRCRLSRDTH